MQLLHKSDIADEACGNIVHITRTISAMVSRQNKHDMTVIGDKLITYVVM